VHGHILNLIEKGVDRIFYPMVFAEHQKFDDALNSYNCPIVTGYPDVVRSAIDPHGKHNIPLDMPPGWVWEPRDSSAPLSERWLPSRTIRSPCGWRVRKSWTRPGQMVGWSSC
jgi:hypothetical protein